MKKSADWKYLRGVIVYTKEEVQRKLAEQRNKKEAANAAPQKRSIKIAKST